MSPRKARLVAEHIRGRSVPEARTVLAFTQRAAAREIEKVLRSAVANAEANHGLDWNGDDLVRLGGVRRRGPDDQALARARARPRRPDPASAPATSRSSSRREAPASPAAPQRASRSAQPAKRASAEDERRTTRKKKEATRSNGSKSSSRRDARRRHPRLEVELVDGQEGVPGLPDRGHPDPRAHLQEALARGPVRHPDPQGQAADHGRHLHGAPRHRDRQVGRRGRRAPQRAARHHQQERPHQHQRDQASRARREARRAVDRGAAPEPRVVPARDEALARLGDPLRRAGRQDHVRRPPRRRRDEPLRDLLRGPRPAAHDPRRHRLRLRRGEDDVRPHRRQGLDQQGRDHAGGLRRRAPRGTRASASRIRPAGAAARSKASAPRARAAASRSQDREGLGPVRAAPRAGRRPGGGAASARGARPGGARATAPAPENVERPRTDEQATSAEGREQP